MRADAMTFLRTGGPEVLTWTEIDVPEPGPGQALIRQTAIGVNFIDIYHRTGLYPVGSFPSGIGLEGAGVVEAIGPGVSEVGVGDRVAYASPPLGAYSEWRCMPADRLVRLPAGISDEVAAAMMLKGLTAQYLLRQTYQVKAGDTIVFYAAAGGVGSIACQWARHLGAEVIGVVGSEDKARLAREFGCAHTIVYTRERVPDRVREITSGKGVPVVYDSVGQATFFDSLDCLAPRGLMVSFGNASGPVPPFNVQELAIRGSLYLTRPTLATYTATRAQLLAAAEELFDVVLSKVVHIHIGQRLPLSDAAEAHRLLESRATKGAIVLLP
ncbi:MAG: quinone oxidoreductase [candidate division KSB1 bacterium]|nr:quinone oxidoreductase [candidate division KSB1 bacterium]